MDKTVGTVSRGIRAPIIREGDNIQNIVVESVLNASKAENFSLRDKDVIAITEAIVARAQGNYATIDHIAKDIKQKFPNGHVGVVFPIMSRNRFAICLKGFSRGAKKITLLLSMPSDEVGNHIVSLEALDKAGINPYTTLLTEQEYRKLFGRNPHPFTGVDYLEYYRELIESEGTECEIILSNTPSDIVKYTKDVLCADVHSRARTKALVKAAGAQTVYGMDDILTEPMDGSGFNSEYGLLGSNKATENSVKLFPKPAEELVYGIQKDILDKTGAHVEVMIYGDGAFKDPVGKIWELADPVVSPNYTSGLEGTPKEVKLKYLADNDFADLSGEELAKAISDFIKSNPEHAQNAMVAQGTTPRRLTDLIGSLCDLTSGSGDKGTPIILVQGYFDKFGQ